MVTFRAFAVLGLRKFSIPFYETVSALFLLLSSVVIILLVEISNLGAG